MMREGMACHQARPPCGFARPHPRRARIDQIVRIAGRLASRIGCIGIVGGGLDGAGWDPRCDDLRHKPVLSDTLFCDVFENELHSSLQNPDASFLLALWQMARDGDGIPPETRMPAAQIRRLKPQLMILRPAGDGDWLYESYGAEIAQHSGFDMTGRRVSDFQGELGAFFRGLYLRAMEERRPFGSIHRIGADRTSPLWERLILPVGSADAVTGLYVVNRVREPAVGDAYTERKCLRVA
jgi:hypothetical protein